MLPYCKADKLAWYKFDGCFQETQNAWVETRDLITHRGAGSMSLKSPQVPLAHLVPWGNAGHPVDADHIIVFLYP